MQVINIHKRTINQSKEAVSQLLTTLATKDDAIWPKEYWPAMRFKDGLKVGSQGGHGIIRYSVEAYTEGEYVWFKFSKPIGFLGHHGFKVNEIAKDVTEIIHKIDMKIAGLDTLKWVFVIRWLHDALTEDALDKIENHFSSNKKRTRWSFWVKFWRFIFKMIK